MDEREERRPASVPTDPEGPDPPGIPDPMPDALKRRPRDEEPAAEPDDDPMEGDAPSG
jgi:hypothetical protein